MRRADRILWLAWVVAAAIFLLGFAPPVSQALDDRSRLLPALPLYIVTPIAVLVFAKRKGWI